MAHVYLGSTSANKMPIAESLLMRQLLASNIEACLLKLICLEMKQLAPALNVPIYRAHERLPKLYKHRFLRSLPPCVIGTTHLPLRDVLHSFRESARCAEDRHAPRAQD